MTCWKCGAPLPPDAGFCRACGAILRGNRAPAPPPPGDDAANPPAIGALARPYEPGPGQPFAAPATPGDTEHRDGVDAGDLVALCGSVIVAVSVFMGWYSITISAAGMRYYERVVQGLARSIFGSSFAASHLPAGPSSTTLSAVDHNAGGWRWAILVIAAVAAVELLLTVISVSSSRRSPGWPHEAFAVVFSVTNLILVVVAFSDSPSTGLPAGLVTSSPAAGAYIGLLAALAAAGGGVATAVATSRRRTALARSSPKPAGWG